MASLLETRDLSAGYTHVPVIRDVSISVDRAEMVGLLGPNGAGKTTLLRTLAGSISSRSGTVEFEGAEITKHPPHRRARLGLAHVPEGRQVFAELTVADNLRVAGLINDASAEAEAAVIDLFPRLGERLRQLAGTLSGGEQQMLAIGRALMTGPRVLMVDEMSAGLAPILAQELVTSLARIRDSGVSILVVEQSPHLIDDVVDRVYLLQRGSIVAAGALAELGGAAAIADLYLGVIKT